MPHCTLFIVLLLLLLPQLVVVPIGSAGGEQLVHKHCLQDSSNNRGLRTTGEVQTLMGWWEGRPPAGQYALHASDCHCHGLNEQQRTPA